jgi:hypothetical protein
MRVLYARLSAHQLLALEVIAAGDAFVIGLFKTPTGDIVGLKNDYAAKRANFERVMTDHENG